MHKNNIILLLLFSLSGIVPFNLTKAQEFDSTAILVQRSDTTYLPSRGNHVFTSITTVDDPFVSTKFYLGFGIAEIVETEIPISIGDYGKTIIFEPDIFYSYPLNAKTRLNVEKNFLRI